jgi:hypothetical protein
MAPSSRIATVNTGFQALIWDIVGFSTLGDKLEITTFIGRNGTLDLVFHCGQN